MPEDNARTRQAETRKLAAIMFTDIVGFSRQMGTDEARMLRLLDVHNQAIQQAVAEYHGTVIKTVGDAFLVDFPSVVHAVQCAQRIQAQFHTHNVEKDTAEQIHVRIGIHSGDIVQRDGDVFGDGVNITSRLQGLAEPDTVCISDVVYRDVAKKVALGTVVSLGRPKLKNIAERFQIYALLPEAPKGWRQTLRIQRLKLSRRVGTAHHRVVVTGLILLVSGIVAGRYLWRPSLSPPDSTLRTETAPAALPLPDKPSIAVLPLTDMSGDPEQEYFSDGMTEDLITDLSKLSGLFVIARNSSFFYKGKTVKVQDISRELGVRYVLEGSVRKAQDQLRVTAQLIDATTGGHLWSERYDRPLQDLFALQDEVRQKIVLALKVNLLPEEQKRFKIFPTNNLEAYDYFLRGAEYWNRITKEANAQARQMCEKAIELDPTYAAAYALLSSTYWLEWGAQWGQDPQALEQAFILAQKARDLDDSLFYAHQMLGLLYVRKEQYEPAIAEAERAIALAPNSGRSYVALGNILAGSGKPEESIGFIEKGMRLDPQSIALLSFELGRAYYLAGRHDEALVALKRVIARYPAHPNARLYAAAIYSETGQEKEAQAEAAEHLRVNPQFSLDVWEQRLNLKDRATQERLVNALRKAGLK